jgi:hypothetical protein
LYLKQSTASQIVAIGPFLDDTDFKTTETGLTISNTDIRITKNDGSTGAKNSGGATHLENGIYRITLDATDTDTVGNFRVSVFESGALPYWRDFFVVEEAVFAEVFAASAALNVNDVNGDVIGDVQGNAGIANGAITAAKFATDAIDANAVKGDALDGLTVSTNVTQIGGSAASLATLKGWMDLTVQFTVQASPAPTLISCKTDLTSSVESLYSDRPIYFEDPGSAGGQIGICTGYDGTTKEIKFQALQTIPTSGDTARVG